MKTQFLKLINGEIVQNELTWLSLTELSKQDYIVQDDRYRNDHFNLSSTDYTGWLVISYEVTKQFGKFTSSWKDSQ